MSLEGTLKGWGGYSSAGTSNEELIRNCFYKNQDMLDVEYIEKFEYKKRMITLDEIKNGDIIFNELLILKQEKGIDEVLQIKTGKEDTVIRLGKRLNGDSSYELKTIMNIETDRSNFIITGARSVGKTEIMKRSNDIVKKMENFISIYINAEELEDYQNLNIMKVFENEKNL
ncbi:hypothetical protein BY458DRAFT_495478 [Sporodiniella umbellata]|nr:hypothetical protein BY458DRAFT_495478 [Sporodiniella umbellata]